MTYRDGKGKKSQQQQDHQQPRGPEPAPPNPYQGELQGADDTWERVLCAMERLEYLVDQRSPQRSAIRSEIDRHRDRDQIQVTVFHAQAEVDLQIKCFWYAVSTVRGAQITHHFLTDFLCWLGGREQMQLPLTLVDEYAIGTINCILGEQMERLGLPELPPEEVARYSLQQTESRDQQNQQVYVDHNRNLSSYPQSYGENIQPSQPNQQSIPQQMMAKWMQDAIGWMTQGMVEIEKLYDHFLRNPDEKAVLHHHQRGSLNQGLERLAKIAEASQQTSSWFNRFVQEWQSRFHNQR